MSHPGPLRPETNTNESAPYGRVSRSSLVSMNVVDSGATSSAITQNLKCRKSVAGLSRSPCRQDDESLTDAPRVAKMGLLVQPWARGEFGGEFGEIFTRQIDGIARDYSATGSCIRN